MPLRDPARRRPAPLLLVAIASATVLSLSGCLAGTRLEAEPAAPASSVAPETSAAQVMNDVDVCEDLRVPLSLLANASSAPAGEIGPETAKGLVFSASVEFQRVHGDLVEGSILEVQVGELAAAASALHLAQHDGPDPALWAAEQQRLDDAQYATSAYCGDASPDFGVYGWYGG